ncbi:UDP-N-acetylmuramoyl-L-alanyl-D-glutamate--2,6-diaminopimelate ligase [Candidatus Microgenomates bacterium]|nr:UDP-N-acetylmuramoyl-L-alanyl-D-glutamate--2,6-diaminopimelate ligase [Candidatus Microgenomates bacterium]
MEIISDLKRIYHLFRAATAVIWFRYPARNLKVIGVTGTDGKTTTSTLIYYLLHKMGKKVALISTVAAFIGDREIDTGFHVTTPDSWMLQRLLRKIAKEKYQYVILEATSHGLDQYRLFGTNVSIGVLTNITHEHLDYHKTYENYVKTKAKLFSNGTAILNEDDNSFMHIKKYIPANVKIVTYNYHSIDKDVMNSIKGRFSEIYNQYNAIAAITVINELGIVEIKSLKKYILSFPGVPGRMQEVKNRRGFRTIVDFAHTPNALKNVLETLKGQKLSNKSKLIVIFGCASQRDTSKRPLMGKISRDLAEISIFTAEDPRFEDVNEIIDEIELGAKKSEYKSHSYFKIPDREMAIDYAINKIARKSDIVIICGKGHEKSMNYKGKEIPWSDIDVVQKLLKVDNHE